MKARTTRNAISRIKYTNIVGSIFITHLEITYFILLTDSVLTIADIS
jgi:hypothetical protein